MIRQSKYINLGEVICPAKGYVRGHGTRLENGNLIATVSGQVKTTSKLIAVHPVKKRYVPEVGHVIVGEVVMVDDKKWKVDICARQHATLALSAIHLPGGAQRRRTEKDALQMRNFFQEGDILVAEVQQVKMDVNLHTRNLKYGRLVGGCDVTVPQVLIKRSMKHFISLSVGVDIILGCNGRVWLTATPKSEEKERVLKFKQAHRTYKSAPQNAEIRLKIARVRNSIVVLGREFMPIKEESIMAVYHESINRGLEAKEITREGTSLVCHLSLQNAHRPTPKLAAMDITEVEPDDNSRKMIIDELVGLTSTGDKEDGEV